MSNDQVEVLSSVTVTRIRVPNGSWLLGTAATAALGLALLGGPVMAAEETGEPDPIAALRDNDYAQFMPFGFGGGGGFYGEPGVRRQPRYRDPDAPTPPRAVGHRRRGGDDQANGDRGRKPAPSKPAGPLMIAVSIGSQRLTLYDNGNPIATAPVSTGMTGRPTPMGIFSVIQKDKYHHSNIYSGAPMPFMQRITWSGIALHAGVLPGYPASHGCIRMPNDFSTKLFGMTGLGVRVIVSRNTVTPQQFEHPQLLALITPPEPRPVAVAPPAAAVANATTVGAGTVAPVVASGSATGAGSAPDNNTMEGLTVVAQGSPAPGAPVAADDSSGTGVGTLVPSVEGNKPEVPAVVPQAKPAIPAGRPGPISIFISRREGKLFVRKGFEPLFEMPITIAHREAPLGTHLFSAIRPADGDTKPRWLAMSMEDRAAAEPEGRKGRRGAKGERPVGAIPVAAGHQTAAEALDRIEFTPEMLERLVPMVTAGSSLIISDQGLGRETGKQTDFIVLTH